MLQDDLYNFKGLITTMFIRKKLNTKGEYVCWNKLRWMKCTPNNDGQVLYKQSFSNDEEDSFKILDFKKKLDGPVNSLIL